MLRHSGKLLLCGAFLACLGCIPSGVERNPFLTFAGTYGFLSDSDSDSGSQDGDLAPETFRDNITITFTNLHTAAEVDTSFAAWIDPNSVRTSDQQDVLLAAGYTQLTSEVQLGNVFTLPVGAFVYNGPGIAGASQIRLGVAEGTGTIEATDSLDIIAPDGLLVFKQPPVSCDSVAFEFVLAEIGRPATGVSTSGGGVKTFAQINVYQCDPLKPGLFLDQDGGTSESNEYRAGAEIAFEFSPVSDANGFFAAVTITN